MLLHPVQRGCQAARRCRTACRSLVRLGDNTRVDIGQFIEPRVQICRENDAAGGAAGSGNDEVMGASASAVAGGVSQKVCMVLGHQSVVGADRYDGQDLVEECPLCCLAAGVLIEEHTGKIFGDDNRRYGDVRLFRHHGLAADGSDKHPGVEDQAFHGSLSSPIDAAARAVPIDSAKLSSRAADPRHRVTTAFNAAPVAAGAGAIDAIRRPARVTTIVSPCSTESRTAEKFLDASDALTSRIGSDYRNLNF
jgi:hypothetical protein